MSETPAAVSAKDQEFQAHKSAAAAASRIAETADANGLMVDRSGGGSGSGGGGLQQHQHFHMMITCSCTVMQVMHARDLYRDPGMQIRDAG